MKLRTHELTGRLQQGPLPDALLLYGQDQGLVLQAAEAVRQALPEAIASDFDCETFFGGDLDEERFLTACRAFPMFAPRRLVWVKNADRLNPAARKTVAGYLNDSSASTVLLATADNLEAANPLRKGFESDRKAWCVPFYPLEGRELGGWIRRQLTARGYSVDNDALFQLGEQLGGDTAAATRELEKLILFLGDQRRIGLEEVLAVVGETTTHSGFALAAAITAGQTAQALAILERLMQSGEEPLGLLGMIAMRLRRLAQAAALLERGDDPKRVAGRLKIFWKEQALFFSQCQAIPSRHLADGLLNCLEADTALKSGGQPVRTMERLVMKLAGRFDRRRGSGRAGG